ncbi:hypothetical protein L596_014150 [Steinernema carpocapsae]|uniref:G-protein coupled receptors family 1 profile domain-containing protein n=1 Tax=Steinernema carpocapsae TaxID=34508 RepID=A0A4U5NBW5_STECR|nr:hypothetical protein L596_014150 [Steinernema carpocapsae]
MFSQLRVPTTFEDTKRNKKWSFFIRKSLEAPVFPALSGFFSIFRLSPLLRFFFSTCRFGLQESLEDRFFNLLSACFSPKMPDHWAAKVIPWLYASITVIGVLGNICVLITIFAVQRLHDTTNYLIANLALADLLFVVLCVPFTAYSYMRSWPFSKLFCVFSIHLQYICAYASVWTLVLLALDRFMAVVYPVKSQELRNRRRYVIVGCVILWVLVTIFNFFILSDAGVFQFETEENGTWTACVDSVSIAYGTADKVGVMTFYLAFNIFAYFLPLTVTYSLYYIMLRRLWANKAELKLSKEVFKMKKRVTHVVLLVSIVFGVCWFLQNLRFFIQALDYPEASFWQEDMSTLLSVQSIAQACCYANSCLNPILYGLMSNRFRHEAINLLSRIRYRLGLSTSRKASDYEVQLMRSTPRRSRYENSPNGITPKRNSRIRTSDEIELDGVTTGPNRKQTMNTLVVANVNLLENPNQVALMA